MQENRINATIAITALIAAVLMAAALSFAIGKWSWGQTGYQLIIKFPNATGITANSEVKYAGAHAGRVREVRLIRARSRPGPWNQAVQLRGSRGGSRQQA